MNVLTLGPATLSWPFERGVLRRKVVEVRRDFTDLIIDGKPLRQWFDLNRSDKLMPPLSHDYREAAALAVETLSAMLGESAGPYQDECTPLLICGMDTDPYCGALGVRIAIESSVVRWDVGWHFLGPDGFVETHTEPAVSEPRGFVFQRQPYEALLRPARDRFRADAQGATAYRFVP